MLIHHAGIDVSKQHLDIVLLYADQTEHHIFYNSHSGWQKLVAWLTSFTQQVHICLEATGRYGDGIATYLFQQGYDVSVVNPARIHAYGLSRLKRQKTDKADALLIAQFCQTQQPHLWTPPDPALDELKIMVRHREQLQQMLQQERNRLGSLPKDNPVCSLLQQHITFIEQQLTELQITIHCFILQHSNLTTSYQLLQSIPGIGQATAATLMAEIGDFTRFDQPGQVAAYAGLTPQHRRSGSSVRGHTHISKRGNARLRKALYFPAMVAMRHNPILASFSARLKSNGLAAKSVIVAVMRKLLHIAFGVLRSQQPFDPNFQQQVVLSA